jgi:hypothetical protein
MRLALGKRRGGAFPGSPAPCGARGRTRPVPAHGPGGWRVGLVAQTCCEMSDKHHHRLGQAPLVRDCKHSILHRLSQVILGRA